MTDILPSLISSDLLNLKSQIKELEPYAAGFHLDIMDFNFVPNLTWGPAFVNAIRQATTKKIELHMMVQYPEKYLDQLHLNIGDIYTIHIESKSNYSPIELLTAIKKNNWTTSIALKPETPLEALIGLGNSFDRVLLMSVPPGFSGQAFLPQTIQKLQALMQFKQAHNASFTIAIDGGITFAISQQLLQAGANELAIASAIFANPNPIQALQALASQ